MFSPGAPLLVGPALSWHKLSWMAEFTAAIPRHDDNTIQTVRLAIEARGHLQRMAAEAGIAFDVEERGILHVYRTRADFEAGGAGHRAAGQRRSGTAGGHALRDAQHRAGVARDIPWRVVHAV